MKNDIAIPLLFSILIHGSILLFTAFHKKSSNYIIVPVELSFFQPQGSSSDAEKPAAQPERIIKKQEDEIAVPRKKKDKKQPAKPVKSAEKITPKKIESPQTAAADSVAHAGASSSQISINSVKFPYPYYTNLIAKKIGRNWQWANEFGQMKAVVFFRINKDGSIGLKEIKTSSGDSLFDRQALRAVELSGPFPPLPDSYSEGDLGVYFEFAFKE